jgi:hypothetical protein
MISDRSIVTMAKTVDPMSRAFTLPAAGLAFLAMTASAAWSVVPDGQTPPGQAPAAQTTSVQIAPAQAATGHAASGPALGVITPFDPSKPPPPLPAVVHPATGVSAAEAPVVRAAPAAPAPVVRTSAAAPAKMATAHPPSNPASPSTPVPWAQVAAPSGPPPELTPRQAEVVATAARNGDHDFLMVDKVDAKLIVIHDGKPILAGPALTGASPLDRFPPGILAKDSSYKFTTPDKVTPAGRFTLTWTIDPELGGKVLEINEVHGKDWWIAIHRVYLGIPAEHRKERLYSGDPEQGHITFGCINVTPVAMDFLIKLIPWGAKPVVYVLPRDQTATETYFTPKGSAAKAGDPPHT